MTTIRDIVERAFIQSGLEPEDAKRRIDKALRADLEFEIKAKKVVKLPPGWSEEMLVTTIARQIAQMKRLGFNELAMLMSGTKAGIVRESENN